MHTAKYITFHESEGPVRSPITKFGGNPVWLMEPEWPLHPKTEEPMLFIGQVELDSMLFGNLQGQLAYLFASGPDPLTGRLGFRPEENAIIIQPRAPSDLLTAPLTEGPSVCRIEQGKRRWLFRERIAVPSEFTVETVTCEEPDIDRDEDDPLADFPFSIEQSKIGGQVLWIQGDEWPYGQPSPVLLQLVWGSYPFHLDLGDAGTLYACLSPEGDEARITWQCY